MTTHIKVEEAYVEALMQNAAWDAARVSLGEKRGDKKGDEGAGKDKGDKPDYTTDARKGDKGKGKDKDDKPDYTTDARKGDKSKTHKGKDFEDNDEMKEAVDEHVCPLCESTLEEALTDEQIQEHVAQITQALETIEEEDDAEISEDDETPVEKEEEAKESSVMKKVKELKAAAKGG